MNRIKIIKHQVAQHYQISLKDLNGRSRLRKFARPRHVAMWLSGELTLHSSNVIGREFQRDHSTVLHGINLIDDLVDHDVKTKNDVNALYEKSSIEIFKHERGYD